MSRIKYRSVEVCEKRRLFAKRLALISGIFLIATLVSVVYFLRIESIQIREISIDGSSIIDRKEIEGFVSSSLLGDYCWVIPKSNTFLYSVNDLKANLEQRFPGISSLAVGRDGFKKIYVKIIERKPEALWCKDGKEENIPECYFVDSNGIVFAQAPYFSGNVYFMYRGDLNKEDPLGAQIFTTQDFSDFSMFIKQAVSKLGLSVTGVEMKEQGDFDLLLSSGVKVLLNKNMSYDQMYNNIDAVLKSKEFSSSTLDTLEYVDMRFGNKIYFKSKTVQK